jgi:predicted DNA-binding protein
VLSDPVEVPVGRDLRARRPGDSARGLLEPPCGAPRLGPHATRVSRSEALDAIVTTMYTYTVDRTQIYLTPDENASLERESIKTGKTKSQLIRDAIDEKYGNPRSLEEFMAALNGAFGLWANPEGEAAVKAIHAARRAEARITRARLRRLLGPDDPHARTR